MKGNKMKSNILKSSAAAIILFLGLGLGSCNDNPDEGKGVIQHPQNHDHVMGEGLGEGELEAADDTLETLESDTLQERRRNEMEREGGNR